MAATREMGDSGDVPLQNELRQAFRQSKNEKEEKDMVCLVKKIPPRNLDSDDDSDASSPNTQDTWEMQQESHKIDLTEAAGDKDTNSVQDSRRSKEALTSEGALNLERIVPKVDCPEKIVICIDLCSEMDSVPFKFSDGSRYPPLFMVKRVVEIFLHSKSKIDKRHEFALVAFYEIPHWLRTFTNDPKEICSVLEDLNETRNCESCDLSSMFNVINENAQIPEIDQPDVVPPPYVVRVVLIYGRSHIVPQLHSQEEVLKKMLQSLYFFLDILYIHDPPSEDNCCQEIFDTFCALDERLVSYIFEVTRNTTKLHNCMAKLLAHPLQRPHQHEAEYKLNLPDEPS